ncbi:MAG: hypothetical protein Q8L23_00970 [Caulobacter sp.]|nr:hypothetical protein [Caulobacter sp.]
MFITKYHTDSGPPSSQPALPADAEASLRAELAERISGAQAEIEHHLTELRRAASAGGDATPLLQADAQREGLGRLQHRLAQAHGAGLVSIRAEVSAFVAAAQAVAQQVRTVAATAQAAEVALHAASAAAHREVTDFVRDFYERKIFDPYLRFASTEDEEAYRRRESERQEAIRKALAEGTPEGDLRANRLAIAQLEDAGVHGADRSSAYAPMLGGLKDTERTLASRVAPEPEQTRTSSATPAADPLDRVKAPVALDPALLASVRATGVVVGDQDQRGHGLVPRETVAPSSKGRT